MLLFGAYQQDYRDLFNLLFNDPLMWHVHALKSPWLNQAMVAASVLGKGHIVAIVFLVLLGLLHGQKRYVDRIRVSAIMLGTAILTGIGKLMIQTARPMLWQPLEQVGGSSFPSSHASGSLSLMLAIFVVLPPRWRIRAGLALFAVAFVVGFSRIYLGVHAPTDILLTWVWAGSWCLWIQRCLGKHPIPLARQTAKA